MRWHAPVQCRDRILKRNCLFGSFRGKKKSRANIRGIHLESRKREERHFTWLMEAMCTHIDWRYVINELLLHKMQEGQKTLTHTHTRPLNVLQRQI
jgi:hypothetical protein